VTHLENIIFCQWTKISNKSKFKLGYFKCRKYRANISTERYILLLPAAIPTRGWACHSSATVHTVSEPTGSDALFVVVYYAKW